MIAAARTAAEESVARGDRGPDRVVRAIHAAAAAQGLRLDRGEYSVDVSSTRVGDTVRVYSQQGRDFYVYAPEQP